MAKIRLSKIILISLSMLTGSLLALGIQFARSNDTALPMKELRTYAEVLEYIKQAYVEPVDDRTLIESSISGMLSNLDSHSGYFNVDAYKDLQKDTQGVFGGIGIEITSRQENGMIQVIAPIDNTPAYKAGIKSNDFIIKVNHKAMQGMTLNEVVKTLEGKPGTKVTLTILRQNISHPLTFVIERAIIKNESVRGILLDKDYGYIRIAQFQSNTHQDLVQAINALYQQNKEPLKGLVVDLRSNPGGLLNSAIGVSSVFLPKNNLVVYTKGRNPHDTERFYASPTYYLTDPKERDPNVLLPKSVQTVPIVILINSSSASGSEIVAGALQDYRRAHIIGTQSFGKGSVQSTIPLSNGGGITLTVAYYFTPNNRCIQAEGITPDKTVADQSNTFMVDQYAIRESNLNKHLANPQNPPIKINEKPALQSASKPNIDSKNGTKIPNAENDYQLNQALIYLKTNARH